MCGLAGVIGPRGLESGAALRRMLDVLAHRGPDGEGSWSSEVGANSVNLGHRRLAIIDLSAAAGQPMFTADGRHALIFNGEIYNYLELRTELEHDGVRFSTRSDSEVLLQALIHWGSRAFSRLNGMWALVFLDIERRRLVLARDRLGKKPLYFHHDREARVLWFASEIKGVLAGTARRFAVDLVVVNRYLTQQLFESQSESFFSGIVALPAATSLTIDLTLPVRRIDAPVVYWTLPERDPFQGTMRDRIEAVRETLFDAVRVRLRSDVPVGVLLSGGLDSSCVAAAARRVLGPTGELHVLSAVNDVPSNSEEPYIDRMAWALSCRVDKERFVGDGDTIFAGLERAVFHNDEPVGGLANVAHLALMERARDRGVTVLLSGQGGDELACGYLKYAGFYAMELLRAGRAGGAARLAYGFARRGTVLRQFSLADARRYLPGFLRPAMPEVRGPHVRDAGGLLPMGMGAGVIARQAADLTRLSVPALVHYEDRMSMAYGREVRAPLLDVRLVELLQPMDPCWKLRNGWTKWLLRAAMAPDLPGDIAMRRDKQGFITPESIWVARELRSHIEGVLKGPLLTEDWGLVSRRGIKDRYREYLRRWGTRAQMRAQDVLCAIVLEVWARLFESSLTN